MNEYRAQKGSGKSGQQGQTQQMPQMQQNNFQWGQPQKGNKGRQKGNSQKGSWGNGWGNYAGGKGQMNGKAYDLNGADGNMWPPGLMSLPMPGPPPSAQPMWGTAP